MQNVQNMEFWSVTSENITYYNNLLFHFSELDSGSNNCNNFDDFRYQMEIKVRSGLSL
jgi:hypothetical protein